MKRLLTFTIALALFVSAPFTLSFAEDGPATYFVAVSGTTETGDEFDLTDLTGTFKIGLKTDLAADGLYRLVTTYRQVNIGPLADDIKTLGVGAERHYPFNMSSGFFKNSGLSVRAAAQFELNQESNNVNALFGLGWIKKLAVDAQGNSVFSIEPFMDFTAQQDRDFVTVGISLDITPPILK